MIKHDMQVFGRTAQAFIRTEFATEHDVGEDRPNVDVPIEVVLDGTTYQVAAQRDSNGEWDALDPSLDDDALALRHAIEAMDARTSVPMPGSWGAFAEQLAALAQSEYERYEK